MWPDNEMAMAQTLEDPCVPELVRQPLGEALPAVAVHAQRLAQQHGARAPQHIRHVLIRQPAGTGRSMDTRFRYLTIFGRLPKGNRPVTMWDSPWQAFHLGHHMIRFWQQGKSCRRHQHRHQIRSRPAGLPIRERLRASRPGTDAVHAGAGGANTKALHAFDTSP